MKPYKKNLRYVRFSNGNKSGVFAVSGIQMKLSESFFKYYISNIYKFVISIAKVNDM